ncbi:MAG: sugar phosphate isomerase/epimerase [Candidatus Latescibacteria bacterium]|nr:sugar phosphate isomerase/epimerase [Candidatus Latescibacterota bacterium]
MRFGGYLAGIGPATHYGFANWYEGLEFQVDWAKRLGWRCFAPSGFGEWSREQRRETVTRLAARDLVLPGLGAYHLNITHPDPAHRGAQVKAVQGIVEEAADYGVASVETIAGTWNPQGGHLYYPGNKSEEAWRIFIASCRAICDTCTGTGVRFILEPYQMTLLDGPASLKRAVDEVDRPDEIGINFDLVNLITIERYYDITALIDEVLAAAGPFIQMVHFKDIKYVSDLTVRMDEVPPGDGNVDFIHWLRGLKRLNRDIPAFIEHLRDMTQMTAAWTTVRNAAAAAGFSTD